MKINFRLFLKITLALIIVYFSFVQSTSAQGGEHTGFYLSMGIGPEFGNIKGKDDTGTFLEVQGTAYAFDMQIGGAIRENVLLHGTVGVKSIFGPTINDVKLSDGYTVDEYFFGAGMTCYLRQNYFVSGNLALGQFSLVDESTQIGYNSDNGFSYQLKAGKEWWVSPRWAIGFALELGGTFVTNELTNGASEKYKGNRFGLRFNATMNGRK